MFVLLYIIGMSHNLMKREFFTSASRSYVINGVCPSVCLLLNSVTQKVLDGFFFPNYQSVHVC